MTAPTRARLDLRAPDGTRITLTDADHGPVLTVAQASAAEPRSVAVVLSEDNAAEVAAWLEVRP